VLLLRLWRGLDALFIRISYKSTVRVAGLFLELEKKIHSTHNDPIHEEIFVVIHLNIPATLYAHIFSTCHVDPNDLFSWLRPWDMVTKPMCHRIVIGETLPKKISY
jgi:hypothetical protein